jgi:hypothetical protein
MISVETDLKSMTSCGIVGETPLIPEIENPQRKDIALPNSKIRLEFLIRKFGYDGYPNLS